MANSLHDPRYRRRIEKLVAVRNEAGLTQRDLAKRIKRQASFVAKTALLERRLDFFELIDILAALECAGAGFLAEFFGGTNLRRKRKPRSAAHSQHTRSVQGALGLGYARRALQLNE